jgi:putative DNA primase/helicase
LGEVVAALGIDPGKRGHQRCPLPGHDDEHPSFRWDSGKECFFCTCGSGDALDLIQAIEGVDFPEAVKRVAEILGLRGNGRGRATATPADAPPERETKPKGWAACASTWSDAHDLDDPAAAPGRAYLEVRGLKTDFPLPEALRLHPRLAYREGETTGIFPAILGRVVDVAGEPIGLQRIWLAPDGSGKAPLPDGLPAKKALGALAGGAVRLDVPRPGEPLVVAEGLETALAVRQATGLATWAAVSASVMAALVVPADVAEVVIAADLDRSKAGEEAARKLAARLTAEGRTVRVALPPGGPLTKEDGKSRDFLDVLNHAGTEAVREAIDGAEEWEPTTAADFEPGDAELVGVVASIAKADARNHPEGHDDRATIARLAALTPLEYDRVRDAEAVRLGARLGTLDAEVKAARPAGEKAAGMVFPEVTPWPEPVDGEKLFSEIAATVRRFVVCESEVAIAAALWCAMTWLMDVVDVAPLLHLKSPEKRCGKTVLLTLLRRMVSRPIAASNISPPALFRAIEAWRPTLLVDEADSFLRDNEELRGVINSGHHRETAFVMRCEGEDFTPRNFTTWAAKAIAGIGNLADTIEDRAIILDLRRKLPSEKVERLRHATPELFEDLRAQLARFAEDHREEIRLARPELPEELHDRAQDNFEPLLAIADAAEGGWPKLARAAALKLSGKEEAATSVGVELLVDIRAVFDGAGWLSTADLIKKLTADPERRWASYYRGAPISPRQLAAKLRPFDVRSKSVGPRTARLKGFDREQFTEAFSRYLPSLSPDPPVLSAHPLTRNENNGLLYFSSAHGGGTCADKKQPNPLGNKDVSGCADKNPPRGDKGGIGSGTQGQSPPDENPLTDPVIDERGYPVAWDDPPLPPEDGYLASVLADPEGDAVEEDNDPEAEDAQPWKGAL